MTFFVVVYGRACNLSTGGAEVFAETRSLYSGVQCYRRTVSRRAHQANARGSICNGSVQIRRQRQEAAQSSRHALRRACRSAPGDAMVHAAHIASPPSALYHAHVASCLLARTVLTFCGQSVFDSALFVEKYPRAEIRISIHVMQVFSHSFSSLTSSHHVAPCTSCPSALQQLSTSYQIPCGVTLHHASVRLMAACAAPASMPPAWPSSRPALRCGTLCARAARVSWTPLLS